MLHCKVATHTKGPNTVKGEPILLPELIEVAKPADIQNTQGQRQTVKDDVVDIFISAAMVNPKDSDRGNEWIGLINLGAADIDLSGWTLSDNQDNSVGVGSITLKPGESTVVNQLGRIRLANKGEVIKLHDEQNNRIDWVNYTEKMVKSGMPVLFLSPRDTLALDV